MNDTSQDAPEPANLRFLRRLVTALTLTMIFGLLTIIGLFVMRFSSDPTPSPIITDLPLPADQTAVAYTEGLDFFAIVTSANQILIFNKSDKSLRETLSVRSEN